MRQQRNRPDSQWPTLPPHQAQTLLILGVLTRPAALVLAFTMVVAWLMVGLDKTFALDAVGAWAIENLVYFFVGALAIALLIMRQPAIYCV